MDQAALPLQFGIVIPTRNEAANVGPILAQLEAALQGLTWEVIFVDDNSPDGTADIVRQAALTDRRVRILERIGRRGLSSAVVEGMLASAAPVMVVMDGDLQHDEAVIEQLYRAVAEGGYDIAVGARYVPGGSVGEWNTSRAKASRLATRLTSAFVKTALNDPMSGFFAIRRETMMAALPRLSNVGFKILFDLVASCPKPPRVVDIPITFRPRLAGESKVDAAIARDLLVLLLEKSVGRYLPVRFLLFAGVGSLGLLVQLGVLGLGVNALGAPFAYAEAAAVFCAMTFNFLLNNGFTYRDVALRGRNLLRGLLTFYAVCLVGAVGNVGVGQLVYNAHQIWWVAGIAGAVVGVVWNYATSAVVTWKR